MYAPVNILGQKLLFGCRTKRYVVKIECKLYIYIVLCNNRVFQKFVVESEWYLFMPKTVLVFTLCEKKRVGEIVEDKNAQFLLVKIRC